MLSFQLPSEFVQSYAARPVKWGFVDSSGSNSLGELTFLRTYSRVKEDGSKERWHEVCARVVNGAYSILKDHCQANRLPWNENKARASAQEAFDRMFDMKWLPPGRGLWMMGTPFVHEGHDERGPSSAPLQNCAFVSTGDMTKHHPERPFEFLMEASMLGVGVGFDTEGAKKGLLIQRPERSESFVIPDTREGWVEAMARALRAFLVAGQPLPELDYSAIRPAGEPIRGFGGKAAGPGPLRELVKSIVRQFDGRAGEALDSRDIVDVANLIGRCVVAGNVRRSAEIALGDHDDKEFLSLKDYERNPERAAWGWVSNNSIRAEVGDGVDYELVAERIRDNGEPGLVYLDLARRYGRLVDPPNDRDYRVLGVNPCSEQTLESYECCTLVETFPTRCESKEDWLRTLKFAYIYAKAVTLLPTHWPETNAVMQRNRRIGCSVSGLAEFVERQGWTLLRDWLNAGYAEINETRHDGGMGWDPFYSEWLGVRSSIKTTSIKPSGSVSLLAGVTPGVHWPRETTYIRRIRLGRDDPLTEALLKAGYTVEPSAYDDATTVVAEFPVRGPSIRTEREVTVFEKVNLAILAQRYWADNAVSLTVTFDPETEGDHIANLLRMHEGQLKTVSFLPSSNDVYAQMPYEGIEEETFAASKKGRRKLPWAKLYAGAAKDAVGEKYCETDVCEVPQ